MNYFPLHITVFCLLLGCQNGSNNVKYHSEFENCPFVYNLLEKQTNPKKGEADEYYYQGERYTGCARMDHPKNERYFIYWFEDGYVTLERGYYYNGQLGRVFHFEQGLRDGSHKMYYEDGVPYIEEYYKNGKPDSLHFRWHASAQLAREAKYKKGKLKWEKIYDQKGKLIKEK